ncbi:MAG TPA: cytochrome b [Caulobacteraceae bacterium]|jgi:cytochrome b561
MDARISSETRDEALRRYSLVAMSLHWLIAALILTNIGIAWYFNSLHGLARLKPIGLHQSLGLSVLILSVARLAWRLANPPPPLPAAMAPWERWLAHVVHMLFYVVMIGMPLTGWAMRSASSLHHILPIRLFALPWPAIAPLARLSGSAAQAAEHRFETAHGLLAKLTYALVVLHVGAALRHQFMSRDLVVARMVPFLGLKAPR